MEIKRITTFFYYKDVDTAAKFYGNILGFELAMDLDWVKTFKISSNVYLGLVNEKKGYHRSSVDKPVMITLAVEDIEGCYKTLISKNVVPLSELKTHHELGFRLFLIEDPEGYILEYMESN